MVNENLTELTEMIRIDKQLKQFLDNKKIIDRETYNDCLYRLMKVKKNG